MTPLDRAHAAMEAAPEDEAARLAWYEALVAAELVVPVEDETAADLRPRLVEADGLRLALAFEGEARLAEFAGASAYAALPGRALVAALAGRGLGLGVNLPGPGAFLMPPEAVDWLAGLLSATPAPVEARPHRLSPPHLPPALLAALDRRLARAAGLAQAALLAAADWGGGRQGLLLAVIGCAPDARPALAQALAEALAFSGAEGEAVDIAFPDPGDALAARLARVALRFDLTPPPDMPGRRDGPPPRLR